jgi:dihydrolipoamide dehydrogenase
MAERQTFDSVVIGAGTGGYVAAIRAAQLGLKTALVEREKVGGVCLHRGCIPTKVLLQSADMFAQMQRAEEFGLKVANLSFDYLKIRARVDKIVGQLHKGVEFLLKKHGVTVINGTAELVDNGKIGVTDNSNKFSELQAKNIVLAVGSRWQELKGLPFGNEVISVDGALAMGDLPKSVVIVGAGQTGVEFASFYSTFGVKVHLIESASRILPAEDSEITAHLEKMLSRRGVNLYLNTTVRAEQVTRNEGGLAVKAVTEGKPEKEIQAEKMLVAIGRRGNADLIGIANLKPGLKSENGFLRVDENLQISKNIYAIGDVMGGFGFDNHKYMLAHASSAQGIFVMEKIAGKNPDPVNYDAIPRCTYANPQVASIGFTEQQARIVAEKAGRNPKTAVKVGKFSFKANGRALMLGENEGFVKVIADARNDDILGVHITGLNAVELIGEAALAKLFDGSAWELAQAVRPHPAQLEAVMEAARATDNWAIHG